MEGKIAPPGRVVGHTETGGLQIFRIARHPRLESKKSGLKQARLRKATSRFRINGTEGLNPKLLQGNILRRALVMMVLKIWRQKLVRRVDSVESRSMYE
jgi:hypothetical protein